MSIDKPSFPDADAWTLSLGGPFNQVAPRAGGDEYERFAALDLSAPLEAIATGPATGRR